MITEKDIVYDSLIEDVFPEFDEAIESASEHLMHELGVNPEMMVELINSWFIKRARQTNINIKIKRMRG